MNGIKQLVISDLTLKELEFAPINVQELIKKIPQENIEYLILDDEAKLLAEKYIDEGAVSDKFILDAQHIAIATLGYVDVIVSWNFKHIVNLRRIHLYNSTNLKYGYQIIEIRTPREVLNEE